MPVTPTQELVMVLVVVMVVVVVVMVAGATRMTLQRLRLLPPPLLPMSIIIIHIPLFLLPPPRDKFNCNGMPRMNCCGPWEVDQASWYPGRRSCTTDVLFGCVGNNHLRPTRPQQPRSNHPGRYGTSDRCDHKPTTRRWCIVLVPFGKKKK